MILFRPVKLPVRGQQAPLPLAPPCDSGFSTTAVIKNSVLLGVRDVRQWLQETPLPENALPQLHADDPEDEEHEETQQQHVPQHRQGVQEQHDQYAHTCNRR